MTYNDIGGACIMRIINDNKRITFKDGYDLFPNQYVLLGETTELNFATESGTVLAVGNDDERDAMWDLYVEHLLGKKHGRLLLFYFGNIETVGALL
jgi:hypothetical protein